MSDLSRLLGPEQATTAWWPLLALVVAVVAVVWRPAWRWSRALVTMLHEGGHAVVALAAGRRLAGIRLHTDTSGVTVSSGPPTGTGVVMTLLAGYPAASAAGLVAAALVAVDRPSLVVVLTAVALGALLLSVRNVVGFLAVALAVAAFAGLAVMGGGVVRLAAGHALAWFFLLGAVRAVGDLAATRRRAGPRSDADQLAALTGVPAVLWVGVFVLLTAAAAALGGWLLVRDAVTTTYLIIEG